MPTNWEEERKLGALGIEQEIDRQLAELGIPILNRCWICDKAGFGTGIEYVYTRSDGRVVRGRFNPHELKWFRKRCLPETTEKIHDVVTRIAFGPADSDSESRDH